jgi:glycosyltransferase involved in cell wall biosynthesis
MKDLPLVSFIIPYYNAGTTIQETIDSIFDQSYSNFDVWLINDGSTDQLSIDKLKEFEGNNKIHLLHQDNAGPSMAKNNGVLASNGKYLCFLDSDNIILEEYISEAIQAFQLNKEIDLVYSDFLHFGDQTDIHYSMDIDLFKILIGNPIDNCVIIKKESFLSVNGFDEYLSKLGLEDWELWINLLKNGKKFHYLKKVHFKYRVIKTSRTQTSANLKFNIISDYIYNKHSDILSKKYYELFYLQKMTIESIDYKIGKILLAPYRFLKNKISTR